MSMAFIPLPLHKHSVAGAVSVPPWKLDGLKDLSPGGICETGYGDKNTTRKTLQFLSDIKHKEKYTAYHGWGIAVLPALLDVIPEIIFDDNGRTPFRDIPRRAHAALKKKLGCVSAEQLGFLLSIIPLYHKARAIKNSIWAGGGLDPSGHTMFKIAQYGMMLSIATDHGTKSSIKKSIVYYIGIMAAADALMLANTFTNCHTLVEVVVGGGLGVAVLVSAHLISKHTPLGRWAKGIADDVSEIFGTISGTIANGRTHSPNLMMG